MLTARADPTRSGRGVTTVAAVWRVGAGRSPCTGNGISWNNSTCGSAVLAEHLLDPPYFSWDWKKGGRRGRGAKVGWVKRAGTSEDARPRYRFGQLRSARIHMMTARADPTRSGRGVTSVAAVWRVGAGRSACTGNGISWNNSTCGSAVLAEHLLDPPYLSGI